MTIYSHRGINQSLFPRQHSKLFMQSRQLDDKDGEKLYNNSEPLKVDEVRGPQVKAEDNIVVLDYASKIAVYFLIVFYRVMQ